jgi:short-subunit dehydrogenase
MMKRAIVIGASSGIGFEVARLLLNDGWKVGVAARRMDLLQNIGFVEAAERIDVNDPKATEQLRDMISQLGGMDLFFYASGIGKQNRKLEEDIELQTVITNGLGFTRMIGEAYRYFAEKGEGHIVAITSIAGTKGLGPAPAYSATKAMQNVYLQALEQQAITRGLNIYFTDIRPGFVDTALLDGDKHYPMIMKPEDVAQDIMSAIKHKKHICVINWKFRLLTMLWRRIPRFIWRRMRLNIVLMLMMLGLTACVFNENPVPPYDPDPTELILEVMGERYEVSLSDTLNLRTLTTEFPVDVKVLNHTDFSSITIDGHPVVDGTCSWQVSDIPLDGHYKIEYTTASKLDSIIINSYPAHAPTYTKKGKGQIPGDFYLSFIYQPLIMKVDNDGKLLYYRFEPTGYNGTFQELGCWDFKKHVLDGKTYYSYHAPDHKFADKAVTGYDPGMRILMDEHYNPVDTIHALQSLDGYLPEGSPLDGHDFYFFSPTHWIASASYVQREAGGSMRAVAYLQEVDNGEVVFDWWSTSYPILLEWASPTFDTSIDYVHFNSIDVLPDKNWLVSFRALSTIVKIDRQGDGGILWHIRGEDSTLPENMQFSGQHYVRYHQDADGDHITVFDNGNAHDPSYTHLLRLDVEDQGTKVVYNDAKDLVNNHSNYFTQACGALIDFGSQGFMAGWGWCTSEDDCTRLVTEYDANGTEVFSLSRDDNDPNSVNPSYRCVKCQ